MSEPPALTSRFCVPDHLGKLLLGSIIVLLGTKALPVQWQSSPSVGRPLLQALRLRLVSFRGT
jgi:hypothetical protein